jgi:hypothetical protein
VTTETDDCHESLAFDFKRAEEEQLRAWLKTTTAERVAFFEEMIDLAYESGALTPERLKLRDE